MSLFKKIFSMILASSIAITSASLPTTVNADDVVLPAEIQIQKTNFDSLTTLVDKYETVYVQQVNNNEERIQKMTVVSDVGAISGEKTIQIPSEVAKVMHLFTRFDISGTGLLSLEVKSSTPMSTIKLSEFWRSDNIIQGRTSQSFPLDYTNLKESDFDGWYIVVNGDATITKIDFFEQNGLAVSFDTTAWSVLGGDKEILDVSMTSDASKRLDIEGISTYENEKFKTLYVSPVENNDEGYTVAKYFTEKDFNPGRQIIKFYDLLEKAHWVPNMPVMTEDPEREGYGDYSHFDEYYQRNEEEIRLFETHYDNDLEYARSFNSWPSWQWAEGATGTAFSGTPGLEYFEQAADLAAAYSKAYEIKVGGRTPKWIEVKNEATIAGNWAFHNDASVDSWAIMADFHNLVAEKIHAVSPETLVGGPTAAWMALDANDFGEARSHMKFLDLTKDKVDFYSYHFYEGKDLVLHDTDSNYTGYLTGRLEADLDLLRNHMVLTDNVKPMVISETGTLHSGPSDPDFFIKLKNFNAYMIRYMNRPNEFDLVVPFLLPIMWWDKEEPTMLMGYDESGFAAGELTKMHYFIEAWSEYNGKLNPVFVDNNKVFAHSAVDGNVIYMAVNNLNAQRISLDLDLNTGGANIVSMERSRTYLDKGELFYEIDELSSLDNIPFAVEETSIFKITLDDVPEVDGTLYKETYYGDSTLKPTGSDANFTIKTDVDNISNSVLRVSFGKDGGFKEDLSVTVNGTNFTQDLAYTNKSDRFFAYVDFEVPTSVLAASNSVTVSIPEEGGTVSTVALINHYNAAAPEETVATLSTSDIMIDGKLVSLDAYKVDGVNYFELDDLGNALVGTAAEFDIDWDEDDKVNNILTNTPFTVVVRTPVKSGDTLRYTEVTKDVTHLNGAKWDVVAYDVQGENYFGLRDVCDAIGVAVGWDEDSNTISLTTN